jgi:Uncharacterized conserved protein (DUF2203)
VRHERHWTLEQANAALPYVRLRLDRMRDALEALDAPGALAGLSAIDPAAGGGWPGAEAARPLTLLALAARELEAVEIQVRDIARGLVDFPAVLDGEEVYLCWLEGEPSVAHWHEPDAGFAGRRPL